MNFYIEKEYENINYSGEELLSLIENNKVVVLRNYTLEEDPLEFFTKLTDKIGFNYGIGEDLKTGKPTEKRWVDITYDPEVPDKYRSAPVAQPLHTDASYEAIHDNIQYFYCVSQAKLGGATVFIDANDLVQLMKYANENLLLENLLKTDVIFSKHELNKRSKILWLEGDDYHFNWNYYRIDVDNTPEVKKLAEDLHEFLENRVVKSGLLKEALLTKNDVVFFNDERVLHGRNSYFATEKGQRSLNKGTLILKSRIDKNPEYKKELS
jgi:alpha-ketoglutarate-dependent taurine dioxygenase